MRIQRDLTNYEIIPTPQYILEVNNQTISFQELEDEINEFNREIEWKEMWTLEDAKVRLSNGWKLVIFRPGTKIKGWCWIDSENEPRNIYVNRHYRGIGIARQIQFEILNICKKLGMQRVEGSIDDWNVASKKSFKSTGWTEM